MISKAIARYIRISPRKSRLVADLVRGKAIDQAIAILGNLHKRPTRYVQQVIKSAVSNAKKDPDITEADLYISKITVDNGPSFKRYRAGSMGRAMMIRHRTSHIIVELEQKKEATKRKAEEAASKQTGTFRRAVSSEKQPAALKSRSKKMATTKRGK